MVGQSRRHRRRPRLPPLDSLGLGDRLQLGQGQTQAGVGQHKIMIGVEQSQLLTQPGFVFAQRIDPTPDRRHMLAKVQVEALYQTCIDRPTSFGQDGLDGLRRAKYDAVFHPHDTSAPVGLDNLSITVHDKIT